MSEIKMKKIKILTLVIGIVLSITLGSISVFATESIAGDNEVTYVTETVVYGKVYNEQTGEPIPGALVTIHRNVFGYLYWGHDFTDSDGNYYIKSKEPCGELWVEAKKFGYFGTG